MKKGVKKFIIAIIIAIMIFNVFFPIATWAADTHLNLDGLDDVALKGVDGIVGILHYLPKVTIYAIAKIAWTAISALVTGAEHWNLTPDDIIFSGATGAKEIDLIDLSFFNSPDGVTKNVADGISQWYIALRNLAIVISLVVLIYVGIRMAISAVASEKAKYKQMLKDWAMGFAMLFVLHYLMIAVIALNREFVNLIYTMAANQNGNAILTGVLTDAEDMIFSPFFSRGYGALLVYAVIIGITVAFFIQYIKRFFTIGFLITISPLITVTYSVDKMGDGRSQALNVWLREFIFNVVIQPFHCIIYTLLCTTAITSLENDASIKNVVIAIASLLFVFKAEDIIKNIFGFRAGSMENAAAAGALAWGVMSKFQSGSNKAAKATGKAGGSSGKSNAKDIKRKNVPNPSSGRSTSSRPNTRVQNPVGRFVDNQMPTFKNGAEKIGNAISKTSFGQAAAEFAKDRVEDFEQFKADPLKTTGKGLGKLALKSTTNGFKLAPKLMTGAVVAGMTGNAVTGVAAGYVSQGGPFSRKMVEHADKDLGKLQEDSYTKRLANAIDDFRMDSFDGNNFMSDEELYNKCIDLYDTDISTLTDATEKKLAKRLQEMRDLYDGRGEADSAAKVMSKVSDIQTSGANHSIQIRADNIANAAAVYQVDTGARKSDVIDEVVRIQDGINNSADANENYWRSAQYKGLSKNEKQLAKEIYKSKKLTTAIGNAPQDKLDKAIKEKLDDKLV